MAAPANLGKYRLIAELGQGGMADVYLAMVAGPTGSGFTKLAVIKRLRPNLVEDPEFVAMLVDEARISARLNHPNVVQTLEVGFEHEEYYLAMEFLDGQPLHRVQRRAARSGAPLPRDLACLIVADVLSGLHHAHELADYDGSPLGVVHRDVNPQNVFVTYDGTVKVVDFGIAKAAGRVAETKHGVVKGKVRYMSPEQAVGSEIDRRSDVFAAGLLLWEAVTGKRFWGELHDLEIIQALVAGDFDASPQSVDPSVPAALEAMCRRALSRSPDDRYATTGELRDELEGVLSESAVSARRRLGALVAGMFEKERADIRGVIQRASRSNHDAPSMAVLLGSSQSNRVLAGASGSGQSLAPLQIEPRPSAVPAAQIAPERSRSGLFVAGFAMLAACAVIALELRAPAPGGVSAAGVPAGAREPSELVASRVDVVVSSVPKKAIPSSASALPVLVAKHAANGIVVHVPASAPSAIVSAPAAGSASGRPEQPRRGKQALDTADPWAGQEDSQ